MSQQNLVNIFLITHPKYPSIFYLHPVDGITTFIFIGMGIIYTSFKVCSPMFCQELLEILIKSNYRFEIELHFVGRIRQTFLPSWKFLSIKVWVLSEYKYPAHIVRYRLMIRCDELNKRKYFGFPLKLEAFDCQLSYLRSHRLSNSKTNILNLDISTFLNSFHDGLVFYLDKGHKHLAFIEQKNNGRQTVAIKDLTRLVDKDFPDIEIVDAECDDYSNIFDIFRMLYSKFRDWKDHLQLLPLFFPYHYRKQSAIRSI